MIHVVKELNNFNERLDHKNLNNVEKCYPERTLTSEGALTFKIIKIRQVIPLH